MLSEAEIRALARRVAGRALAERGVAVHDDAVGGVHVTPRGGAASTARARGGRGPELVTVGCLKETRDGGSFAVPAGALVTPLAREEAARRHIRFDERHPGGRRTRAALRVAVGSDHGGFELKNEVLAVLGELGAAAVDLGTRDKSACDYPDFAGAVAEAVGAGRVDLGVVVDGMGIGSAIAANKVPGVRAANCATPKMAANAREHNHANVLTLGAALVQRADVHAVVRTFLTTAPGGDRHARRAAKIDALERRHAR